MKKNIVKTLMALKVSIVPAVLVFGIMLAVAIAIVANSKGGSLTNPQASSSSAAELDRRNPPPPPSYGYTNPRVVSAQGNGRVSPGSTQVPASIFKVYAPSNRSITTNHYRISYSNERALITRLSLVKDGIVIGTTKPGSDSGFVTFSRPMTIPAGGFIQFTVMVDVSNNVPQPPTYGYPTPPTFLVGVESINYIDSRPSVMEGLPINNLVLVATNEAGLLNGSLSPTTPAPKDVTLDATNVDATHITFSAGSERDVVITRLTIGVTTSTGISPVKNIKLYDADTNTLLTTTTALSESYADIFMGVIKFPNTLVIPKNASKSIRIVTDVQSKKEVKFKLGLVGLAAQSPIYFNGPIPLWGNEITAKAQAGPAKLVIAISATSPTARNVLPGIADLDITHINLSASNDADVILDQISLGLQINTADGSPLENIRVYEGQTQIGSVKALGNTDKNGPWGTVLFKLPYTIAKGSTKTLRLVTGVSSTVAGGTTLKLGVVGVAYKTPTTVTGMPVYGNTMTIGKNIRPIIGR